MECSNEVGGGGMEIGGGNEVMNWEHTVCW